MNIVATIVVCGVVVWWTSVSVWDHLRWLRQHRGVSPHCTGEPPKVDSWFQPFFWPFSFWREWEALTAARALCDDDERILFAGRLLTITTRSLKQAKHRKGTPP